MQPSVSVEFGKSKYLTEDELKEVKKAFQIFDQDNSGAITTQVRQSTFTQELDNILKSLGQYLDKEELDELVESIDLDKNGFIDFAEFLMIVTDKMLDNRSEKIFIETFKVLDFDGDGLIREEELEKALKYMNKSLTRDEIKDIMDYACTDQDGITLDAFLKLMLRRF